jgi:hypothetical protein
MNKRNSVLGKLGNGPSREKVSFEEEEEMAKDRIHRAVNDSLTAEFDKVKLVERAHNELTREERFREVSPFPHAHVLIHLIVVRTHAR